MYTVIKFFTDLRDNNRAYNVGDAFPHVEAGYPVSEERLAELAGNENKQGVPLIAFVEEKPKKARKKKAAEE